MLDTPHIRSLIRLAIEEDLPAGDITTQLTVSLQSNGRGEIYAKEALIVCGLPLIELIFAELGWKASIEILCDEGSEAGVKDRLAVVEARSAHLLSAERTLLNFLQRLSGVASMTRQVVRQAPQIAIYDTRKTTPGWRALEKYAVRIGGGVNHRASLSDMVLVKNNHIDANAGDMQATLRRVYAGKPAALQVEVEVRSQLELEAALEFKPEVLMLDNFADKDIRCSIDVVAKKSPKTRVEVSGGITPERLETLSKLGVRCVSMGAVTHSARAMDISMRIITLKDS